MLAQQIALEPQTLWPRVVAVTDRALAKGALLPIATDCEVVRDCGVDFLVRVVSNVARKEAFACPDRGGRADPFLPYDPDLFVADVSETHLCLLNRFNVLDHHLLIVTRAFEEQHSRLTEADFLSLWACMEQVDGLAFYNAGRQAGASQRHKHLQLVPLPLIAGVGSLALPVEALLTEMSGREVVGMAPRLPVAHALVARDYLRESSVQQAASRSFGDYRALLAALNLDAESSSRPRGPYNLLATRHWMLLVPRRQECSGSISVNALGFAGALLVRDQAALTDLKRAGPMEILRTVAMPRA